MSKEIKLRMTRQRRVILEALRENNAHPCAEEIHELVRSHLPKISLGTVYRNLEILTALGEIQTLSLCGSMMRFDGNPKKHYHIRCTQCGRIDDAPLAPLNQLENELYGATVYTIIGHRLEFIGLCPDCTANADEGPEKIAQQSLPY